MGKAWDHGNNFIPAMTEIFKECNRVMKHGAHGLVWALPRTSHWTATALENAGFEIRDVVTHVFGSGFPKSHNLGNGQGTALKPASEHWILVRKKCSEKTVAANVLKHGTGGINVDASRIKMQEGDSSSSLRPCRMRQDVSKKKDAIFGSENDSYKNNTDGAQLGRFPANFLLSHNEDCEESPHVFPDGTTQSGCTEGCAVKMLDEQSGELKGPWGRDSSDHKHERDDGEIYGKGLGAVGYQNELRAKESGGASRFFYCAKASKKDRNEGCETNQHPCVKSAKLMEYLITLVTPPRGVVLDPFMGSGSTGKAAINLGFNFYGIEREKEYFDIAEKRIQACRKAVEIQAGILPDAN